MLAARPFGTPARLPAPSSWAGTTAAHRASRVAAMGTPTEGEWINGRGQKLYTVAVSPDRGSTIAVLVMHHGYGGEWVR